MSSPHPPPSGFPLAAAPLLRAGDILREPPFPMPGAVWRACPISRSAVEILIGEDEAGGLVAATAPPDLRGAAPSRRAEFLAGRICALLALRALGFAADPENPASLGRSGRTPLWPAGAAGSISHAGGWAMAAAARRSCPIGLDFEPLMPEATLREVAPAVVSAQEAALRPADWSEARFATFVFSAKEAAYKALSFRLGGHIPEFHEARLASLRPDSAVILLGPWRAPIRHGLWSGGCLTFCAPEPG